MMSKHFVLQDCGSGSSIFRDGIGKRWQHAFSSSQKSKDHSVEVEPLFARGHEQPLAHDGLRGVVGQLEVVDARVDAGVGAVAGVDLPHDGQAGVEVGQTALNEHGFEF